MLNLLAFAVSTRPIASVVIHKIARAWRQAIDRRCEAEGIGQLQATMDFLLDGRLLQHRAMSEAGESTSRDDRLVAASSQAQDLWLHMVGLLLPRVRFHDEPRGPARIEHDWERLVSRFRSYPLGAVDRFLAARELAAWMPLPPREHPLCGAIMAWCYWNAVDPMRNPIHAIEDGRARKVWPKTFDRYTALANKPVHWSVFEGRYRADRVGGCDYERCVVCGAMAAVPSHQYDGLNITALCGTCRHPWTRPEAAPHRIDRERDTSFHASP
jgi:hypothetical protein